MCKHSLVSLSLDFFFDMNCMVLEYNVKREKGASSNGRSTNIWSLLYWLKYLNNVTEDCDYFFNKIKLKSAKNFFSFSLLL